MPKITLNISKKHQDGIVSAIEEDRYFGLNKAITSRAELYAFAIAAAILENKEPLPPRTNESLVRVSYLTDYEALLSSLFFYESLKDNTEQIDQICERDEIYFLAEKYANSGFDVLEKWHDDLDAETLFYKLIGYMDSKYKDIEKELKRLLE